MVHIPCGNEKCAAIKVLYIHPDIYKLQMYTLLTNLFSFLVELFQ